MLASLRAELVRGVRALQRRRRDTLSRLAGTMDALSPLSTLRRGYAVPLDDGGRLLRTIRDFAAGLEFDLRVVDGKVRCESLGTRNDEVTGEQ
jgi:exodeoxyribonuclease VII large subunit